MRPSQPGRSVYRACQGVLVAAALTAVVAGDLRAQSIHETRTLTPSAPASTTLIPLPDLSRDTCYGVLVSIPRVSSLAEQYRIDVTLTDAAGEAVRKTLHAGDPDLYYTLRPRQDGDGKIALMAGVGEWERGKVGRWEDGANESAIHDPQSAIHRRDAGATPSVDVAVRVEPMALTGDAGVLIAAGPNADWRHAQAIELGKPVFAGNDERPYVPGLGPPDQTLRDMFAGPQWFTFTYAGPDRALVHFIVDLIERDIPVDVKLFTACIEGDKATLTPYEEGIERFVPEQSTTFHGLYKMIARVLRPGTYYLRVMGNHPAWQLRTRIYEPPPYLKPGVSRDQAARKAIRTAMDYLVNKGDSWHANTPRRGSVVLRTSTALQETQLCIACHPTHFTTRSQLVAVENGWPVRQRNALKFLTERLYNNPRPIYGYPDAAWVRMISAPGNVLGRLAYMEMTFEDRVSKEPRDGIYPDITNWLDMYWQGVGRTIDESTGNLPRVSGFEIAMHSWIVYDELYRRTADPKYLDRRWQLEKIIRDTELIDMMDLSWKAVALATFDRSLYHDEIRRIVDEIFSHQRDDGTWPMVFGDKIVGFNYYTQSHTEAPAPMGEDGKPVYSEFQTYHCLYALAKCGVTADDPRLTKALDWCLSRQWTFGGWQGNAEYKNFDTVFRETQYAIMALSELYKGPGSDGWMAGFDPSPASLDTEHVDAFLAAVDQYWIRPSPAVLEQIRAGLSHPQPLVREAAAACLGRIADADSLPLLAERLGDPSKMVQRAAACAVREIATRRHAGRDVILAALDSDDDRTRWGAAMVFNQHFRYLAQDTELLGALIDRLQRDPSTQVRLIAAQALPKWWFWLKDASAKVRVEQALIEAMGRPEHPWVRRALIEGFRNTQDENVRYLYNTWTVAAKGPGQKEHIEQAHAEHVTQQAKRVADVLANGNDLQRDGVLRSYYTFHLHEAGRRGDIDAVKDVEVPETYFVEGKTARGENQWIDGYKEAAAFDPLTQGTGTVARLGNDAIPPQYYEASAPVIASGLMAVLNAGAGRFDAAVLKTLRHARGVSLDDPFSTALIGLAAQSTRPDAGTVLPILRDWLPDQIKKSDASAEALASLISDGDTQALSVAAAVLAKPRNADVADNAHLTAALQKRLSACTVDDPALPALLTCATFAASIQEDAGLIEKVFAAGDSDAQPARDAAFRLMLESPRFLAAGDARSRFDRMLRAVSPDTVIALLDAATRIDYKQSNTDLSLNLALGITTTALQHDDARVRIRAVDTVRAIPKLQDNPAVVTAIRGLAKADTADDTESAKAFLASHDARGKLANADVTELLDFDYFARHVQPILQTPGPDKTACVTCHAGHSIFKLNPPDLEGRLTPAELRENYQSALKVVDLESPEQSLILVKPTSPFDGIGNLGAYRKTHGGDVRWKDAANSDPYRTLLKWIQGARVTEPVANPEPKPPAAQAKASAN